MRHAGRWHFESPKSLRGLIIEKRPCLIEYDVTAGNVLFQITSPVQDRRAQTRPCDKFALSSQTQLGHSSPNVYAHLLDTENQAAACRLDDVIFGNRSQNGHRNDQGVKPCDLTP
jgi:hypothetical protein